MVKPVGFVVHVIVKFVPASTTGNGLNLTLAPHEVCVPIFPLPIGLPSVTSTVYTPSSVTSQFCVVAPAILFPFFFHWKVGVSKLLVFDLKVIVFPTQVSNSVAETTGFATTCVT